MSASADIVWLRDDFRLDDQPAILAAADRPTLHVYVHDDSPLNGRPLGRIWNIGPQKTLYVPGPWLHRGENEIVVFDLNGRSARTLLGRDQPLLDSPASK